jgi:hypothetical protein
MLILGTWLKCDDGEMRPVVQIGVEDASQQIVPAHFLVDTGADRTVFNAALAGRLGFPSIAPPAGLTFQGVGGTSPFIVITTTLELPRHDQGIARVKVSSRRSLIRAPRTFAS